jgi:hypothetical protein
MRSVVLGLVLALGVRAQTTGSDQTGSISGTVRDSITRMPVKKATVTMNPMMVQGNPTNGAKNQATVVTDASGTFAIGSLMPGQYRVTIQHQNYPQAKFGGVSKNVEVKAGDANAPFEVVLIPGGSVSGRVLDEEGEPLQGCFVQPRLPKSPDQGVPTSGNASTNENGEYRFYSVPPGKYILMAQCRGQIFQPRPFSAGPDRPPSRAYPIQYYPLAADPKAAQAVELMPGMEKSDVDFRMRPAPVTQIHGVLSAASADSKGPNLNIQLFPVDRNLRNGINMGANIDPQRGTFEFRQVFPGSYVLVAFSNDNEDKRVGVAQRIEVSDQPLAVVLELRHAMEVSGKAEFDASSIAAANANANANANAAPNGPVSGRVGISISGGFSNRLGAANILNGGAPSLSQVGIQMFPTYQIGMPFPQTQVSEDGSFTLKGVIPGTWRLQVNGPSAFVKQAWLGSTDITNAPIDLSNGAAGPLRIVLSTNTGTIRGAAPPGQTIYAQSVEEDVPFRSGRGAQADPTGQYRMDALPPGKYRLVMTDSFGPIPDEGGQEVTVHEGETVVLDLKAPPAP